MTIIERLQKVGFRRTGSPKRFRYRGVDGRAVSAAELARIEALRIPPAWREVAISPSARTAVQAIGKDAAGRWQYVYHAAQVGRRERRKQKRLVRFIVAMPRMRRVVARDLAQPGLAKEKVLAGVLRILATCFLRPGSEVYAQENGSYGIATLRRRHVSVRGDRIEFDFQGKSGKRQRRELRDRRLARLIRELLRYPGEVFKFRDAEGVMLDLRTRHINAYIKERMGEAFSAKDFRTWAGTLLCACALARMGTDGIVSKAERKRRVTAAFREVAEHLGNTPAVCRASYVFPSVVRQYERGKVLHEYFDNITELSRQTAGKVERSERALLQLLGA